MSTLPSIARRCLVLAVALLLVLPVANGLLYARSKDKLVCVDLRHRP
jgi:hypothetical protein